ncbi:MAG TPA: ubiquitin-like small modifier protein 1 [Actinomycetota bacterium]|nr:ubiquitin-like small modifier protein 1 [Actinomycetota bacterium]
MPVTVKIPTVFRKFTDNESTVEVVPGTIADLIDQLEEKHPGLKEQLLAEDGQLHRFVNIYVNDEDARYLEKLETKVSDGETVSILPSVAGGSSTPVSR